MHRSVGVSVAALLGLVLGWSGSDAGRLFAGQAGRGQTAKPAAAAPAGGPQFQVDPLWPKPLPNHWILGSVTGVAVDAQDHIWIVHRGAASMTVGTEMGRGTNPPTSEYCCSAAPPVLEFDAAGNLVSHWGGPGEGYNWPTTPGGIAIDPKGVVWITGAGWPEPAPARGGGRGGRGADPAAAAAPAPPPPPPTHDAHILKFSRTGQFLQQFGKIGVSEGNASRTSFNRPANIELDVAANEVYVADGHGHRRVVVLDAATGAYKRHWGAYGAAPDETNPGPYDPAAPAAKQFRVVSCVALARDGLVYVCDRQNDRIQVFRKDGTFVKETVISKETRGNGSVWDIAFSSDAAQQYLFVADGHDHHVAVVRRDTLAVVGKIGGGGRWPGAFNAPGSVAVDSRGNVYTGETFEGKRVQKFAPRR